MLRWTSFVAFSQTENGKGPPLPLFCTPPPRPRTSKLQTGLGGGGCAPPHTPPTPRSGGHFPFNQEQVVLLRAVCFIQQTVMVEISDVQGRPGMYRSYFCFEKPKINIALIKTLVYLGGGGLPLKSVRSFRPSLENRPEAYCVKKNRNLQSRARWALKRLVCLVCTWPMLRDSGHMTTRDRLSRDRYPVTLVTCRRDRLVFLMLSVHGTVSYGFLSPPSHQFQPAKTKCRAPPKSKIKALFTVTKNVSFKMQADIVSENITFFPVILVLLAKEINTNN